MFWNQFVGADSAEAVIVDVNTLPASPENLIYRTPGGVEESDFAEGNIIYEEGKTASEYISEMSANGFGEYNSTTNSFENFDMILKVKSNNVYKIGTKVKLSINNNIITSFTIEIPTTTPWDPIEYLYVFFDSVNPTFSYKYAPLYNYYAGDETTGGYSRLVDKDLFDAINNTAVYHVHEEATSEVELEAVCDVACKTAGNVSAKVASSSNYILRSGNRFTILFTNANTSASALTLNVNSTGAKAIYINGEASSSTNYTLPAGLYSVLYDGTNYQINTDNTIPGVGSGDFDRYKESIAYLDDEETTTAVNDYTVDAVCTTAGNVANKIAFCDGYVLTSGNRFSLLIANENTYQGALTLNVNGTGAKPIYLNGKPSSGEEYFAYNLPAGTYEVVYGSTATAPYTDVYHINTSGEIPSCTGSYKENAEKVTYLDSAFASKYYYKGDYIDDDGILRKALQTINTGHLISDTGYSTTTNVLGEPINLGKEITLLEKRVSCTVNYEQTQIASKSYSIGDYVYIDTYVNSSDNSISPYNSFRKITTAISSGADITNYSSSVSTLGDEISKLNSDLASKANKDTSNFENQHAWLFGASGNLVNNYYNIVQIGKYLLVSITFTTKTGLDSGSTLVGAIYYKDNNNNNVYPALTAKHYAVLSCFQGDNNNVVTIAQTAGTLTASNALTSNTWYQLDVILKLS